MRQDQDDPVYHTINDADYQHNQLNVTGSQSWYDWQREEENERRKRKFEETQRAVQERARLKRREKSRAGSDGGGNEQSPEAEEDGDDSDLQATIPTFCQEVTPLQLPTIRPTLMLGPYQTREAATEAVMEYAIAQGYMLVLSATAKEKPLKGQFESDMPVIRVDMMCDRGGVCKSHGTGKRKRTTHRIGCPARMKLVSRKRDCYQWVIQIVCEQHNHNLSPGDMEGFATYRRWRRKQAGKPAAESAEDRSARRKRMNPPKPKPAPSVPAPVFHSLATPLPPALPPATEKTSPIHMAALKGQGKILEILLNKGADVNGIDASGRTPLHCGVESGKMDIIRLLLERGADVTKLTTKGVSVLQLAVEKALEDAVVMFIESGADPNI
ncbi:hypothetical protein QBC43DRAFT_320782 [Cladorrhinum sp. PSN259]|nr:hypothetical protein QBC43DRAFT_320782 [Cladorrhinum sp. PSN259]